MKTFAFIALAVITVYFNSCITPTKGNGNIIEKEIAIEDYREFMFGGSAAVYYESKPDVSPYLRIEVDENIFPILNINSTDRKLSIQANNIAPTKFIVYTNSTSLQSLEIAGSSTCQITGTISGESLKINVSGNTRLVCDSVDYDNITIDSGGSNVIEMTGKTNTFSCDVAGNGLLNLPELQAKTVKCTLTGRGNVNIHAEENLDIKITGSGDVAYSGNPKINQIIVGRGNVSKIE